MAGWWFHDLRCSFVTNTPQRGIAESVVLKMSGHRTRAVFDHFNIVSETDLAEAIARIEAGQAIELAAAGEASVTIHVKIGGSGHRELKASSAKYRRGFRILGSGGKI